MELRVSACLLLVMNFICFTEACLQCEGTLEEASTLQGYTTVAYAESEATVRNPERGPAALQVTFDPEKRKGESYETQLNAAVLADIASSFSTINIIWRIYYLDYTDTIEPAILETMQIDFDAIRAAGFKVTVRFAYTDQVGFVGTTEASPSQISGHIDQLKQLLQDNRDVILTVQMGFVGVWGGSFYTSQFGNEGDIDNGEWTLRRNLVTKWISSLPADRMLQVLGPFQKRGVTQKNDPLEANEYRSTSTSASRIGHQNDCFLASDTDWWIYENVTIDYPYLQEDTKYVPMGGATCPSTNPPRSQCTTAKQELRKFHWSWIDVSNNTNIIRSWTNEGCYEDIINYLGYRIRLVKAAFPSKVKKGSDACFHIRFKNEGYAAPINPRDVRLILRDQTSDYNNYTSAPIYEFTSAEPWLRETGTISVKFPLKIDVPEGVYDVLLELSDPLLYPNPDYNILILSEGVGEIGHGLNHLLHQLTVEPAGGEEGTCGGLSVKTTTPYSTNIRCYRKCNSLKFQGIPDVVPQTPESTGITITANLLMIPILMFIYHYT